jgi:hypothetical protein
MRYAHARAFSTSLKMALYRRPSEAKLICKALPLPPSRKQAPKKKQQG